MPRRTPSDPVNVSRETTAAADELWAMVSDVTRMGEWSPETVRCEWKGGATGPAVGAEFGGSNRHGRTRWSTTNTVIASETGRRFAFETHSGPIRVSRWEYTFEPTDTGCLITEAWTDQRGYLVAWFGGALTRVKDRSSHNRTGMEATLERLTAAAERSPDA